MGKCCSRPTDQTDNAAVKVNSSRNSVLATQQKPPPKPLDVEVTKHDPSSEPPRGDDITPHISHTTIETNDVPNKQNIETYEDLVEKCEELRVAVQDGMVHMVQEFDKLTGSVSQVEWPGDGVLFVGEARPNPDDGHSTPIRHGRGQLAWQDGAKYKGQFEMNQMTGWGIYEFSDNRMYQGQWLDNQMHGVGIFSWQDGREYTGEYYHDKKEGFGLFKWPDGRSFMGYWANGKQNGRGVFLTGTGQGRCGIWENGERVSWEGKGFDVPK